MISQVNDNQTIHRATLANGLTLVAELMPWLESAAYTFMVPSGCRFDPRQRLGLANFTCEMVYRGAGERDNCQLVRALEGLGVKDSTSVTTYNTRFAGVMPAESLLPALQIVGDVVQRPHLPGGQLEQARRVCLQELRGRDDDLANRVMQDLRLRYFGNPLGRDTIGTTESLHVIGQDDIHWFFENHYQPQGTILAVAGRFDWPLLCDAVNRLFGQWQPKQGRSDSEEPAEHGYRHLDYASHQTHIALAFPSVSAPDPKWVLAAAASSVLSDGTSSRLFTEVREKRGLCYSVSASLWSLQDRGCMACYAGTSAERAQQTLDVLVEQLEQLSTGVRADELERLKVQVRSAVARHQESSRARSMSLAYDWFTFNRVRSLQEVLDQWQDLTLDRVNEYLADYPARPFDLVTLGPSPLEPPHGVSPSSVG